MKFLIIFYLFIFNFVFVPVFGQKQVLNAEEKAYIKKFIYPINSIEPNFGKNKDLEILKQLIGDRNVVALGEVTHSSKEIFKLKDRIIRYLVQHKDFDVFSMESPMIETYKINDFTIDRKLNSNLVLKNLDFKIWETKEIQDLIEWINFYNKDKKAKVKFTGFDMQSYKPSIEIIRDFYSKNNLPLEEIEQFSKLLGQLSKDRKYDTIFTKEQNKLFIELFQKIENNINNDMSQENQWLKQNLNVISQNFNRYWLKNRDKSMADNFLWIKQQNADSKFIIWAHNQHIRYSTEKMGSYLKQEMNDEFVNIGFTFYEGEYRVFEKKFKPIPSQKADEKSLEYFLNSLEIPIFLIDLKQIKKENNKLANWILDFRKYRFTGANVPKDEFVKSKIANDFDYLIFIKKSTVSDLLP